MRSADQTGNHSGIRANGVFHVNTIVSFIIILDIVWAVLCVLESSFAP